MTLPRPRGRPRTFDRQAALQAAMLVFWQHGYDGSSIADLTQAMGFTPPTLYAAFGSKEQLYCEVLSHYVAQGQGERLVADTELSAYALLEQYLHRAADAFTDPATPAGCMVSTASLACAAENAAATQTAAALRANSFALLVAKLEQAKEVGELPAPTDTLTLARFYTAIIQGMSVQATDGASAAALHALVDAALAAWPGERRRSSQKVCG